MRSTSKAIAGLTLATVLMAGCQQGSKPEEQVGDNPEQLTPDDGRQQAPEARRERHHRRGHRGHGGFRAGMAGQLLHAALGKLDLDDAKQAELEKLRDKLKGEASRSDWKAFHEALVAAVENGEVNDAKFESHYAAMDKAMQTRRERQVEVLNALHSALDAEQRKQLVASVRERGANGDKFRGPGHHRGPRGPKERAGHPGKGMKRGFAAHGGSERLAKDLQLDDAQRAKLERALAALPAPKAEEWSEKREEMKNQRETLLKAFEQDGFDAKLVLSKMPVAARSMAQQHVKRVAAIVSVLTQEQRKKFAERMRRRGDRKGGGFRGPPGEPPSPEDMPDPPAPEEDTL